VDVKPVPGALVINVGDLLQVRLDPQIVCYTVRAPVPKVPSIIKIQLLQLIFFSSFQCYTGIFRY
jgi:hypothetical protein